MVNEEFMDTDEDIYEKDVLDTENLDFTETKINPQFYLHYTLIKSINALSNPDLKNGFIQFKILVETMENIAKSAGFLTTEYDTQIKEEENKITEKDTITKFAIIGNIKLKLILQSVFKNRTISAPMKI